MLKFLMLLLFPTLLFGNENLWTKYEVNEKFNLEFKIHEENLHVRMSGATTGWIAVGFEPTKMMKDANIIIGYVSENETILEDHFSHSFTSHKSDILLGGVNNVTLVDSLEEKDVTFIEFSIPLDSGDEFDKALIPGEEYKIIFAIGEKDNLKTRHSFRDSIIIRLPENKE